MNCPHCKNIILVMSERQGIEIDYCPQCRGVWLDRGELDKMIERSMESSANQGAARAQSTHLPPPPPPRHDRDDDDDDYRERRRRKKREGFLSDLFDFD